MVTALSNSVLEPQCRTHKYIHIFFYKHCISSFWVYVCVCIFPLCHKNQMNKKKVITTTKTIWIFRFEYVFNIAHSRIVRKSTTGWKLFQRVTHVSIGRGRCRHHYYEQERASASESIRVFFCLTSRSEWEKRESSHVCLCMKYRMRETQISV